MASNQRTARKVATPARKKAASRPGGTKAKATKAKPPAARAAAPRTPTRKATTTAAKTAVRKAPAVAARRVAKPAPAKQVKPAPVSRPAPVKKAAPPAPSTSKPTKTPPPSSRGRSEPPRGSSGRGGRSPDGPGTPIHGIAPYQPAPGERYMNERQLEHFRQILLAWKRELMEEVDRTVHHMQDEASNFPDPNDRATQESEFGLELRTRDRERKLLKKIDSALERIDDGSYGFCEETGEEIGLKRLEARPVATLSLEAQERRELAEKQYGERDDRFR